MAPVKSLVVLCLEACQKHASSLISFGDPEFMIPESYVQEILLKVTDPAQLRTIEINSPHVVPQTEAIWKRLITKQFPRESRDKNYTPKTNAKWYKVYERYAAERAESQREAEEKLRASMSGLKEQKSSRVSKIVDQKFLPRPPKTGRNLGGAQKSRGSGSGAGHVGASGISFSGGSRTKTNTGASVLKRARREAAELAHMRKGVLAQPMGVRTTGTVSRAPKSMVTNKRIAAQPAFRPYSSLSRSSEQSSSSGRTERPGSLAPTGMEGANRPPNVVSDSSDDDEGGGSYGEVYDSEDDVFGDSRSQPRKAAKAGPRSTAASAPKSSSSSRKPTKRSGLLSNAPKARGSEQVRVVPAAGSSSSSKVSQEQIGFALEDRRSSPPPARTQQSPLQPMAKKRKATGIFMPAKKRK